MYVVVINRYLVVVDSLVSARAHYQRLWLSNKLPKQIIQAMTIVTMVVSEIYTSEHLNNMAPCRTVVVVVVVVALWG